MFDKIIRWSLTHRALVLCASFLVLAYGIWSGSKLPVDVFPDLNRPTVTIMVEAAGLAPEEVETLVTLPIEVAVNGTPGLERLRSSSGVGLSVIWMEFAWGTDIYRNRQLVSEKLILVQESLPEKIRPVMGPISSIMGQIQFIGIESDNPDISPMDLRSIADWTLRPRLLSISGVAQVIPMGGGLRQYQVLISSDELRKRNLSLEQIEDSLTHLSENSTGGFIDIDRRELLIRNLGRVEDKADIENSVIGSFMGQPVRLGDVAKVTFGAKTKRGEASVNAKPAVILGIQKQPGTSTLEITEKVKESLSEIQATLPKGVRINSELFRQADFIEHAVDNVKEALRDGAILVAVILFLFLMNLRTTLITLTALPLSFAITAVIFKYFDLEINTMTLGGLAIAVGLLVDDAIVDVENVYRRLRENRIHGDPVPAIKVIFEASKEVRNSIVFATLIVVLVFLPLFATGGLEGRFFTPLGISFIVSLVASLIVSLTLTPVLCSYLLPQMKALNHEHETWLIRWLKKWDGIVVNWVLDKPKVVIGSAVILFVVSLFPLFFFGKEFLPKFNEGTAMVSVILPPGVSLQYSDSIGKTAEEVILTVPEVKSTSRRTGRAELDEHAEGVNVSEVDVDFKLGGRPRPQVLDEIRDKLSEKIPNASINLGQPISHRLDHLLSGVNAQIAIKIFGPEASELRNLATQIYDAMKDVKGVVDLQVEPQVDIPQLKILMLREDALKYGVNAGELARQLELALQGEVTAQVIEGQRILDIFSRLNDESRVDVERIKNLIVKTMPSGQRVLLKDVADVFESKGPNMVNREDMQRRLVVMSNVSGRDLNSVVLEIQAKIKKDVQFPSGYFIQLGGQFESQQKAARLMLGLGVLALIGVFALLYGHFRSSAITLQIMLSIPLALIGSIIAVALSDRTISLATMVAFVTLCGIASRNGIMMVSHYLHIMHEEKQAFSREMILRGSLERLIPVLMTALAAILGLIPLVLSAGAPGKEILHPVAVVIVGGLISSTLLDMWVTPAVFYLIGRKSAEKYVERQNKHKEVIL